MKLLLGLGAILLLGGCAKPAPLGQKVVMPAEPGLSAQEIRESVVGKTGIGPMTGSNARYVIYLAPDGTAQLKLPTGVERGRWELTDNNLLCTEFQNFQAGERHCKRVYREGTAYRFIDTDLQSAELLEFKPGKGF